MTSSLQSKTCEQCGSTFDPPSKYLLDSKRWATRRFCSRSCFSSNLSDRRGGNQSKVCESCGETFYRRAKGYTQPLWERARYCSQSCAAKRTGSKSNRWQGGKLHTRLVRQYGITEEQYQEMLRRQHGVCAVCRSRAANCVDHDHESGQVRGLLCRSCNAAIGLLGESAETVERAAEYLREARVPVGG